MTEAMHEYVEQDKEPFVVDNDLKAEWVLSKIRETKAECEKQITEIKRQMAFYEARIESLQSAAEIDIARLENMLVPYFEDRDQAGFVKATKTQKKYVLPSGSITLKYAAPEFEHDDAALVPWLEQNKPELIKVKKSADWATLKKSLTVVGTEALTEDGEIVPGVAVSMKPERFVVDV